MIKKLAENLYQFSFSLFGSEVYLLKINNQNILVDTGSIMNRMELKNLLEELKLTPKDIQIVLLTHNHFDHTGNIKLFENAKIYGEYEDFKEKRLNKAFSKSLQHLNEHAVEDELKAEHIIPLEKLNIKEISVIKTPGHSKGSVCYYLPKEKILFSGDTIFNKEMSQIGRLDLPNSAKEQMDNSLNKLKKLDIKLLCPGHIY